MQHALCNVSCQTGAFAAHLRTGSNLHSKTLRRRVDALSTHNRQYQSAAVSRLSHRQMNLTGRPFNPLRRVLSTAVPQDLPGCFNEPRIFASAAVLARPQQQAAPRLSPFPGRLSAPQFPTPFKSPFAAATGSLGLQVGFKDHYVLGSKLGEGSFGVVHHAVDKATGMDVAVKVLPKDVPRAHAGSRGARDRLLRKIRTEVETLRTLQSCSNTVELHGVFEDENKVYIVMESCLGGDLESYLEDQGILSEKHTAMVLHECLKVVADCHERNIYHGDIKPANFLIKQDLQSQTLDTLLETGQFKSGAWLRAIDFGCAQQVAPGEQLTRKTGTPVFMAPEVFIGNYGLEADMWSLGMLFYQLVANRFPWWNSIEDLHSTTLEQVMRAVILEEIPVDYGPWTSFSPEGIDLLRRLLSRNPAERITAQEALEHSWFMKHLPSSEVERAASLSNIVPMSRRVSEALRLRLASAQLHRAATRGVVPGRPAELADLAEVDVVDKLQEGAGRACDSM